MCEKIVMIGAGNVAHHLAPALLAAGFDVCQIYSRTENSAKSLSLRTGLAYTTDMEMIYPDADIYIFCLSDDAIQAVARRLKCNRKKALLLHTAGSVAADVFKGCSEKYGVLYPLQTFSKNRNLDFRDIPLFVEGSSEAVQKTIVSMALKLSPTVMEMTAGRRKIMHMAAVWACNFPNHMYAIAAGIMSDAGLDFNLLRPLIMETADKVMEFLPEDVQTGPARRNDKGVMNMHKEVMGNRKRERLMLYEALSASIVNMYKKNDDDEKEEPMEMSLW